jgi:hypothetical protein
VVTTAAEIEGPDHAAQLYQLVRFAEGRVSAIKTALREFADAHGGVPTGEGRVWIRSERAREAIDLSVPGAYEALTEVLGLRAHEAIEFSTTKAAIETVARELAKERGESIKSVRDRALGALRDVGAVERKTSVTYEEKEVA